MDFIFLPHIKSEGNKWLWWIYSAGDKKYIRRNTADQLNQARYTYSFKNTHLSVFECLSFYEQSGVVKQTNVDICDCDSTDRVLTTPL